MKQDKRVAKWKTPERLAIIKKTHINFNTYADAARHYASLPEFADIGVTHHAIAAHISGEVDAGRLKRPKKFIYHNSVWATPERVKLVAKVYMKNRTYAGTYREVKNLPEFAGIEMTKMMILGHLSKRVAKKELPPVSKVLVMKARGNSGKAAWNRSNKNFYKDHSVAKGRTTKFLDLKEGQCRWPMNAEGTLMKPVDEAKGGQQHQSIAEGYCGAKTYQVHGFHKITYCPYHYLVSVEKGNKAIKQWKEIGVATHAPQSVTG